MIRAIRAEWTKFRTLPSSAWLVLAVVILTVGLGAAIANAVDVGLCSSPTACAEDTAKLGLSGVWIGQAVVATMAVLLMTGEYGNRTMKTTLVAMPRRLSLYVAKALVMLAIALTTGLVGVGASLAWGRQILIGNGFTTHNGYLQLSLADGPTLRAAVGTVLYLALIGLLGLGMGALVRDTAAALTVTLSLLFVVPMISEFVSDPVWYERLQRWSPTTAGLAIQSTLRLDELPITPWAGLGVLALYAGGITVAGCVALKSRDV